MNTTVLNHKKALAALFFGTALLLFGGLISLADDETGNTPQELTLEQRTALQESLQANDQQKFRDLLKEYGILGKHGFHGHGRGHGPRLNPEVQAAIEAKDYAAFVAALPTDHPLAAKVTAENFSRFLEMIEAKKSGDQETAEQIRAELGLPVPPMKRMKEFLTSPEIEAAIAAKDYEAFQAALPEGSPLAEKITTENFPRFLEMIAAKKNGDPETARAIADELGFEKLSKMHRFGPFRGEGQPREVGESQEIQ